MKAIIAAFALSLLALTGLAEAQLSIDITGSQFEILAADRVKIRNVTVGGYADKYWATFLWDGHTLTFVPVDGGIEQPSTPPPVDHRAKTELLRGKWNFAFTIISTFVDTFTLNNIPGSQNAQGGYFIHGTDQFGGAVVAAYWPVDGNWSLLNPGIILIDEFFFFYTNGSAILPNSCYYQITKSTGAFSRCFALSGSKTGPADAMVLGGEDAAMAEEAARVHEAGSGAPADARAVDMAAMEKYWIMKGLLGR